MPPVSVCHKLSWKGIPKTFSPHMTHFGFKGSPTLHKCLKLLKSYFFIILSSAAMSILIAVGAVYHTVILYFSIREYHFSASNLPEYSKVDIPFDQIPKMPYAIPVTQPGSAVHQYVSSSFTSKIHFAV